MLEEEDEQVHDGCDDGQVLDVYPGEEAES